MYTDFFKWIMGLQSQTLETINAKDVFDMGNGEDENEPYISFSIWNYKTIAFAYHNSEGESSAIAEFSFEKFKAMDVEDIFYSGFNNFI